jgi:hypothetical protein
VSLLSGGDLAAAYFYEGGFEEEPEEIDNQAVLGLDRSLGSTQENITLWIEKLQ